MKKTYIYILVAILVIAAVLLFKNVPNESSEASLKKTRSNKTQNITTQVQTNYNMGNSNTDEIYEGSSDCLGACSTGLQACQTTTTPSETCDQRYNDCAGRCNNRFISDPEDEGNR